MRIQNNWLFVPLAALAVAFAGCGDDDDKGSKGVEPTGAGTPITAENTGEVQAAVFTTASTAFAKGPGKHKGAVSGTVEVKLNTGKLAQIDIGDLGGLGGLAALNYALKFDNFSDDCKIWLDGTVDLSVQAPNFSYKADLDISGDFDGAIKGEVAIQNGVAAGFWTVNGQRIDF